MTVWLVSTYEIYNFESHNTIKLFNSEEKALKYFKKEILYAQEYYDFSDEKCLVCEEYDDQNYLIYEQDNYCKNHVEIHITTQVVE